jgi:putative transcriptional regulator
MTNHPNRSKTAPRRNPKPEDVKAARDRAGLTQTEAAEIVHTQLRAWQQWEAGDRSMHPAFWELFQIKAKAARSRK